MAARFKFSHKCVAPGWIAAITAVPAIDATRYTDLRGGMSIGPCRSIFMEPPDAPSPGNYIFVGTLGAIVTDNGTGDRMLLTNYHVAAVDDSQEALQALAVEVAGQTSPPQDPPL